MWPGILLEQSHVFIYDVAWNILGQRVLQAGTFHTGTFHTEYVKTHYYNILIYALILFFNISSGVRCMKISREKRFWPKVGRGGGGGGGMALPRNYLPPTCTSTWQLIWSHM